MDVPLSLPLCLSASLSLSHSDFFPPGRCSALWVWQSELTLRNAPLRLTIRSHPSFKCHLKFFLHTTSLLLVSTWSALPSFPPLLLTTTVEFASIVIVRSFVTAASRGQGTDEDSRRRPVCACCAPDSIQVRPDINWPTLPKVVVRPGPSTRNIHLAHVSRTVCPSRETSPFLDFSTLFCRLPASSLPIRTRLRPKPT